MIHPFVAFQQSPSHVHRHLQELQKARHVKLLTPQKVNEVSLASFLALFAHLHDVSLSASHRGHLDGWVLGESLQKLLLKLTEVLLGASDDCNLLVQVNGKLESVHKSSFLLFDLELSVEIDEEVVKIGMTVTSSETAFGCTQV